MHTITHTHAKKLTGIHGVSMTQWLAYLLLDPAAPGLIPSIHKFFSDENIVIVAESNQRWCLEESGKWLENVD